MNSEPSKEEISELRQVTLAKIETLGEDGIIIDKY